MKRKISIISFFIIPIVLVMIAQGLVSIGTLKFNGTGEILENNAVDIMSQTVKNRRVLLENKMLEQWSFITNGKSSIAQDLQEIFQSTQTDTEDFLRNNEAQKEYLDNVFSGCVDVLQNNYVEGLFLILAKDQALDQAGEYNGFFVRDSDPGHQSPMNTDLLMVRGSKNLARTKGISLDSSWSTDFSFLGDGVRQADDFFYQPYVAAVENSQESIQYLGYWSEPFILEDHYLDSHRMISYSIPIDFNGTLIGILGVEVSVSLLQEELQVQELDKDMNSGYVLAIDLGDGNFRSICGNGILSELVLDYGKDFRLLPQKQNALYQVKDADFGQQGVYATIQDLNLYSNNIPYLNQKWVLLGLKTEDALFGISRNIFSNMILAVIFGVIFGVFMVAVLVNSVTRPIARLVDSVRGGLEGIYRFRKSGIREIDLIHEVVENLMVEQQHVETKLQEESEKYRMAVENSSDIFYSFNILNQCHLVKLMTNNKDCVYIS